ncbi:hypothetical protein OESDEN_13791 [Oesophagostomum dentatum]|uniref:Uncharacterized protein n=1 Tax=Oesophagostomum dentatum TaxID=61180 RepID=A0A0B1STA9_OESDE|nr:hypothetical protein OESDEN_13791 [Oesophagostomum dentatum]
MLNEMETLRAELLNCHLQSHKKQISGDQLYQGPLLLRESVSLTDCPSSRFCVRQEIASGDLRTVNFICDQTPDVHGSVFVICQGVGTHVSTTPTGVQSINTCCASDYCNLYVSGSSSMSLYYVVAVILLHKLVL